MGDGLTYERLGRLGFHRWWLPPLALLAATSAAAMVACGLGVVALVMDHASGGGGSESDVIGSPLIENMLALATLALLVPITLAVARLVQRRPAGTLNSVTGRLRWPWFGVCLGLAFALAILVMAALAWIYDASGDLQLTIDKWRFAGITLLLIVLVPLQVAGEEYAARGFLLQTFGSYHRWAGILGSALLFTLMHGLGTWSGFLALFLGATIWALLVIRTGGLEVSIAAHTATNLLAFVITAASGGLDVVDDTTAADAPTGAMLLLLGDDLAYAGAVLIALRLIARHRPEWMPANRFRGHEQQSADEHRPGAADTMAAQG